VAGALLLLSVLGGGLGWGPALGAALGGFAGWTLLEYALHRFVFHWVPQGPLGRQIHFLIHGIHHLDPWDATRLVFPPLAGLIVATPIFGLLWLAFPLATAAAAMAGLLTGYIVYDMTHYHVHHRKCRTRWGKYLKAYHLAHHHKHWNAMFGVSSPLWDVVFRTGKPAEPAERP
jgi:sterol desaturase/sphingolipid hydroxylase (fatty acid hydroxylase superfamily)